uniref:Uncharacterized protein n=1 Tax=Eutreptiella gymnastica TaxID=73025 RepID=A0A7S4CMQ5_9EUGL
MGSMRAPVLGGVHTRAELENASQSDDHLLSQHRIVPTAKPLSSINHPIHTCHTELLPSDHSPKDRRICVASTLHQHLRHPNNTKKIKKKCRCFADLSSQHTTAPQCGSVQTQTVCVMHYQRH